jgi:hypothetical protein
VVDLRVPAVRTMKMRDLKCDLRVTADKHLSTMPKIPPALIARLRAHSGDAPA